MAALVAIVEGHLPSPSERAVLSGMLTKATRPKEAGMSVADFLDALASVLGPRLALPPKPSPSWYAKMGRGLQLNGVDTESARLAATTAARLWRGPISAESLLLRISTLTAAPLGGAAAGGTVARAEFNPDDLE